ncbi:MAG: hypothetical protein ABW101_07575 [Candidatus Thiodiazotropha sp.]
MLKAYRYALLAAVLGLSSGCATSPKSDTVIHGDRHSDRYATQFGASWHEFWESPTGKLLLFAATGRYPL